MIQLAARAALSFGAFLVVASGLLLFILTPGSSQFVISIVNLIMGGAMIGAGTVATHFIIRRTTPQEEQ